jgi:hypothetical protein
MTDPTAARPGPATQSASPAIRLVPLTGLPEIEPGADLAAMIREAAATAGVDLDRRIVVLCQKIVSKAEGRLVPLADIVPSEQALEIGREHDRDPRQVELVLRESKPITASSARMRASTSRTRPGPRSRSFCPSIRMRRRDGSTRRCPTSVRTRPSS